jgi:nucleoside-diphosphate-sugar epimerase
VKVVVTGARGFIGSHVVDALLARGIEVIAFDRAQPGAQLIVDNRRVTPWLGDTRDATSVTEAVALSDGIIHLAGVLGTAETIDNPWPSIETNIHGALNVFQAVRQYGKRAVYITVGNYWFVNSYSITKTTAEHLAWMFNREHGTQIAVVRALNAYGPRQKAAPVRKIMPNFIAQALRGEPITVYGDGEQVMDMIDVRDVADILVRALTEDHGRYLYLPERYGDNPVKFEAGTGRRTTVNDIARVVIEATGSSSVVDHVPMRGGEPDRSIVVGDPETLRPLFDGELPRLRTLEDGVRDAVEWYRR